MPIYAYRCSSCGFENDHLQKLNDPVLTSCPSCGKESYEKQVSAAGFQLKGSGWYVTDFRDSGSKPSGTKAVPGQEPPAKSEPSPAPSTATGDSACAGS